MNINQLVTSWDLPKNASLCISVFHILRCIFSMCRNTLQHDGSKTAAFYYVCSRQWTMQGFLYRVRHECRTRLGVCREQRFARAWHCRELQTGKNARAYVHNWPEVISELYDTGNEGHAKRMVTLLHEKTLFGMEYQRYWKTFLDVFDFCVRRAINVYKKTDFETTCVSWRNSSKEVIKRV